jgi:serine/threonine protein phosphatase 1
MCPEILIGKERNGVNPMEQLLKRLASMFLFATETPGAPLLPEAPFYVIGDIHGRHDLLLTLLAKIADEGDDAEIVCVGDYVDRGEQSMEVLSVLFPDANKAGGKLHCLMGNHEEMMLLFLETPETHGPRWLRNGGLQTLASFGIRGVSEHTNGKALVDARDAMRDVMGVPMEKWLQSLPFYWQSGNVAVVHAGVNPKQPFDCQQPKHFVWGHPDFLKTARSDDVWVVHGHTIVNEPVIQNGRIAIDTGAYATGKLTAAHVSHEGARFLSA